MTETGKSMPEYFEIDDNTDNVYFLNHLNLKNVKEDYEKILSANIPRLLLRRKFINNNNYWDSILQFVYLSLHNFICCIDLGKEKETECFDIKEMFDFVFYKSSDCVFPQNIMEKIINLLSNNPKQAIHDYSILIALYIRIYITYYLMESLNPIEKLTAQLFVDTHIDLVNAMNYYSLYTNNDIKNPNNTSEDFVRSIYELYYSNDMRFYYCGNLPNLTTCIGLGSLWKQVSSKSGPKDIVQSLIQALCSKTQIFRCQGRNNMKILREKYFPQYPDLYELYIMFVRISFLGNYIFCKYRPDFNSRLQIYMFFSDFVSKEERIGWMSENDEIIKYCTKEYFIYLVRLSYALDMILEGDSTRSDINNIVISAMDHVRKNFDFGCIQNLNHLMYIQIKHDLDIHYNMIEPYISKLIKGSFDKVVYIALNRICETIIIDQSSTALLKSDVIVGKKVVAAIELIINQFYCIEKNPIGRQLPLKWFKVFGISKNGLLMFKSLYYRYLYQDIADNAIERELISIYNANNKDFHVLRTFFQKLYLFYDTFEYILPQKCAENQIRAIRAKERHPPWKDLPDFSSIYYYCSICKQWAHPTMDHVSEDTARDTYGIGTSYGMFDTKFNTYVCGNITLPASIKKLKDTGDFYDDEFKDLKNAKIIRKYKQFDDCPKTPLIPIDMIGKVKRLNGQLWALCELCATLAPFVAWNFDYVGFTCGCHSQLYSEIPFLEFMSKNDTLSEISSKCCFYCGITSQKKEIKTIRVVDDVERNYEIVSLYICSSDLDRCKYLMEKTDLERRSKIFKTIDDWRTKAIEGRFQKSFPKRP